MIVLKLGGSLLTEKERRFSIREGVLTRVASEIKAGVKEELIIVHGGGAFGHPIAGDYGLQQGLRSKEQIRGVVLTRKVMGEFTQRIVNALIEEGMDAVSIQPSACVICENRRVKIFNTDIIEGFLDLGLVPVLYGDVVVDINQGFCILSGDQIISYLSEIFNPTKIILAVDVDGIFNKDPKKFRDAELIKEINPGNLEETLSRLESEGEDVTGGIKGKLLELADLAKRGFDSQIINALEPGRLKKALLGAEVIGTKVTGVR